MSTDLLKKIPAKERLVYGPRGTSGPLGDIGDLEDDDKKLKEDKQRFSKSGTYANVDNSVKHIIHPSGWIATKNNHSYTNRCFIKNIVKI